MAEKEKKKRMLTPVGFAKWAHVHEPKANYFDKSKEPKYQIDVCFPGDDPEWKAWASGIKAAVEAVKGKNIPIKREKGDDDKPTGRFFASFSTGEKYPPGVFDKYGKPLADMIGNGSKVRVAYVMNEYPGFGGGINLYLNAVQVLDLVEYKPQNASAYGFTVEQDAGAPPAEDNSDLPF